MALEEIERPKAKERQGGPGRDRSEKLPEQSRDDTRDIVGEGVGGQAAGQQTGTPSIATKSRSAMARPSTRRLYTTFKPCGGAMGDIDWAEHLAKERSRRGIRHIEEEGPSASVLARKYIRQAEGYVREVRQQVFGPERPPFESDGARAERWYVTTRFREPSLELGRAIDALAEATGFLKHDIRDWILMGSPPSLHPAVLRVHEPELEGTDLRGRLVEIEIRAPLAETEVQRIARATRQAWEEGDPFSNILERRGRRMTMRSEDDDLDALMELTPEASWSERSDIWAEDHEPITAEALRMRWLRLRKKKKRLGISDEEETDG